jgi:hypothetical protein
VKNAIGKCKINHIFLGIKRGPHNQCAIGKPARGRVTYVTNPSKSQTTINSSKSQTTIHVWQPNKEATTTLSRIQSAETAKKKRKEEE